MTIPNYQAVMLPLLKLVAEHGSLNRADAVQLLADEFNLTDAERRELLPSGKISIIQSRAGWARTYLVKAGLLASSQRGVVVITDRGKKALSDGLKNIDLQYLKKFEEFRDFLTSSHKDEGGVPAIDANQDTPEEVLDEAHSQLKNQVLSETIDKIKSCSPQFFENLVVDIVVKMGYGGSRNDAGRAIGQSGDEGIDGVINEDRLGLDVIYLQAKRWVGNVSRPEIQKFAGALQGKRAKKGIFITTSNYSSEAREYVKNVDAKIILIDGQQLVKLMWEFNVGLSVSASYEIKKLDIDYFNE